MLLSYEYEATPRRRRARSVDYVIPDDTIKIENPIAVTTKDAPPAAKAFVDYVLSQSRPGEVRRLGLPPGRPGGARRATRRSSPTRQACSRSTTSAAGRRSTTSCSTPRTARSPRSRRTRGCRRRQVSAALAHRAPRAPRAGARARAALGARRRRRCGSASSCCCRWRPSSRVARGRPRRVLGRGHQPPGGRRAALHAARSRSLRRPINVVDRDADRLGAGARRVPRQARRQRAHRPAVRAADDRRRPHAAGALRADEPVGINIAFTQVAVAAGAAVRDAAVRRPLGAAGADRARPRDGGGRRVARRARRRRSSGAIVLPNLVPGDPRRAPRWRSPARSASSARSC